MVKDVNKRNLTAKGVEKIVKYEVPIARICVRINEGRDFYLKKISVIDEKSFQLIFEAIDEKGFYKNVPFLKDGELFNVGYSCCPGFYPDDVELLKTEFLNLGKPKKLLKTMVTTYTLLNQISPLLKHPT